jgi:predicted nucleic acid-binding protein
LLDTNVVIDFLHGEKKVVDIVRGYSIDESIAVTSITLYELLKAENEKSLRLVYDFMNDAEVYGLGAKEAIEASKILKTLKKRGEPIGENDTMIAGIALSNDQTLITEDRGFENIGSKSIIVI